MRRCWSLTVDLGKACGQTGDHFETTHHGHDPNHKADRGRCNIRCTQRPSPIRKPTDREYPPSVWERSIDGPGPAARTASTCLLSLAGFAHPDTGARRRAIGPIAQNTHDTPLRALCAILPRACALLRPGRGGRGVATGPSAPRIPARERTGRRDNLGPPRPAVLRRGRADARTVVDEDWDWRLWSGKGIRNGLPEAKRAK